MAAHQKQNQHQSLSSYTGGRAWSVSLSRQSTAPPETKRQAQVLCGACTPVRTHTHTHTITNLTLSPFMWYRSVSHMLLSDVYFPEMSENGFRLLITCHSDVVLISLLERGTKKYRVPSQLRWSCWSVGQNMKELCCWFFCRAVLNPRRLVTAAKGYGVCCYSHVLSLASFFMFLNSSCYPHLLSRHHSLSLAC